jgi:15-cis-phytoene synthase
MPARPESPPTRALAWLYSPAPQRPALAALCAIEREIDASLPPAVDHQVAHARLAWWHEECERCALGSPLHPLTRELRASLNPAALAPLAGLRGLVDTAVWDLATATFETRAELLAYCKRWSEAMIEPLVWLAAPAVAGEQARTLGAALRESELLLGVARDARAGRVRLPLDELARAGATVEQLARPPWPGGLSELLRARHRRVRAALTDGVNTLPREARAPLRGLVVWAAIACEHSLRAERTLPRSTAAGGPHAPLDGWRAWRAARRATAGHGLPAGA